MLQNSDGKTRFGNDDYIADLDVVISHSKSSEYSIELLGIYISSDANKIPSFPINLHIPSIYGERWD